MEESGDPSLATAEETPRTRRWSNALKSNGFLQDGGQPSISKNADGRAKRERVGNDRFERHRPISPQLTQRGVSASLS